MGVENPSGQTSRPARRGGGVGLGLYVTRQLARAQGGALELAEPLGDAAGARLELRLPLAEPEAALRLEETAP